MHSLTGVIIVASLAFLGTMFDNFFTFASQLLVTDRPHFRKVSIAQALGVVALLLLASAVGSLLTAIPTRWIGVLALAPWALGVYAWRHREDPVHEQYRRGAVTTFLVTIALGGDNLAVWIPLLATSGIIGVLGTIAVFGFWEIVFLALAQWLVGRPSIIKWGIRHAKKLFSVIYFFLGILILVESGTIH